MIFPANSPTYTPIPNPYPGMTQIPQMATNPSTIMAWVQGDSGALSYPMGPNTRAYLFDMNEERFFVKVSDITGVVQPIRSFRYYEETSADPAPVPASDGTKQEATSEYITREELEKALAGLRNNSYNKKGDTHHGKQTVRGTNESRNDESVR